MSFYFIFRKQFYFVVSGLKIIGYGNPDNNLESPCISIASIFQNNELTPPITLYNTGIFHSVSS
jgi:hypothetical protein